MKNKIFAIILLIFSVFLLIGTIAIATCYIHILPVGIIRSYIFMLCVYLASGGISLGASILIVETTKSKKIKEQQNER